MMTGAIPAKCISCTRVRLIGFVKCGPCLESQRRRREDAYKKRLKVGMCVLCGLNPSKSAEIRTCQKCLTKAAIVRQENKKAQLCRCGRVSEFGPGRICEICRTSARKRQRRLRSAGLCTRCRKPSQDGKFLCSECAIVGNEKKRRYNREIKKKVFLGYGGKCQCPPCGESNSEFLTIDHKNNDGGRHRRSTNFGTSLYDWIIKNKFPDILQLLCWNCNMAKRFNGGICPHVINAVSGS